jgi:pimeloyl-ACP methyl ester carboxylesterase
MRRVVLCLPKGAPLVDPAPEETATRDVELAFAWDGSRAGVVGWAEGGLDALELAGAHSQLVDRLVLVSTHIPEADAFEPPAVRAKTLLLYGSRDGGNARAEWWKSALGGRIEMVPGEGDEILGKVWGRVLSHVAPRTLRK